MVMMMMVWVVLDWCRVDHLALLLLLVVMLRRMMLMLAGKGHVWRQLVVSTCCCCCCCCCMIIGKGARRRNKGGGHGWHNDLIFGHFLLLSWCDPVLKGRTMDRIVEWLLLVWLEAHGGGNDG
ncbi:hypothetical protein BDB00DRAFT_832124 [Zychaea mexicana]|uniref:uncharacterized protein n=1 Tax=Zychaea mexicana TaxID=64656 RepID=UPI0022FEF740|nr:uncharacterized protein BDB00DRAFT_832124 [Zychaea mexicana]KAI9491598.1 hypothetical protein BDB00DRAFT_832124 [Zychaea mexicana]